jgi:hypothetical protein
MSPLLKWMVIGVPAVVVLCLAGCSLTRAGYKSPSYKIRERVGRLEIREYPPLLLAQTNARRETEGKDGSFMRLFRFIAKGNESAQKIPMTTPVLYRGEGAGEAMAFVLPADMKSTEVPVPVDPAVRIEMREGGVFAAIQFRGGRRSKGVQAALAEFDALSTHSPWRLEGKPEYAFYDPPWIPWFMEKNEVLWRVVRKGPSD